MEEPLLPWRTSPPYVPLWGRPSIRRFVRKRMLEVTTALLAAISAFYAWRTYDDQVEQGIPKIAFKTASVMLQGDPASFSNSKMHIEYRNIGGSSKGGVRVEIKQVIVGKPSPVIAQGDDADALLKGDERTFDFDHTNIAGPLTALVACFSVDDPKTPMPQIFAFTFDKPPSLKMFHVNSIEWNAIQALAPCLAKTPTEQ